MINLKKKKSKQLTLMHHLYLEMHKIRMGIPYPLTKFKSLDNMHWRRFGVAGSWVEIKMCIVSESVNWYNPLL